jgi:hypothetical protein
LVKVLTPENVGQNKSETFVDGGSVIAGYDALVVDTEQLRKSIIGIVDGLKRVGRGCRVPSKRG